MGSQFIHIGYYAREASKKKTDRNSIGKVLAEAKRELWATPHISNPKPAKLVFGALDTIEKDIEIYADSFKDDLGRKLRKDGLCMIAGVISVPEEMQEIEWKFYKRSALEFLKIEYGKRLKCVLEHDDESHRHIHFFVIPTDGEHFDDISCGKHAARLAKKDGKSKAEQNAAYIAAMRDFQKRFHQRVSRSFGLTRFGPRRRRLTRAAWKIEQQKAKEDAEYTRSLLAQVQKEKDVANRAFAIAKKAVHYYEKIKQQNSIPPRC